ASTAIRTNTAMIPIETTGSRRPCAAESTGRSCTSGSASAPGSADIADARVDERIEAVHAEVHPGDDGCRRQHHRLDHREVARRDALVGEPAQPRPREHGLDHD